jgi:hypothetical protein
VLGRTTAALEQLLAPALGDGPSSDAGLLRRSWSALSGPAGEAAASVYLECIGLAVRGREPYRSIAGQLVTGWTAWVAGRLSGPTATRGDRAHAVVATLDGLLLVRAVAGPGAADAAARGLGLVD